MVDNNEVSVQEGNIKKENDRWLTRANKITIIATIVTLVVTIVASVLVTSYFRDKKELEVKLITNDQIIYRSKGSQGIEGIKIFYNEMELDTPCLIKISVANTGNVDIQGVDFLEQFSVSIQKAVIYYCEIDSKISPKYNEEIMGNLSFDNSTVVINEFSLRKGESFVINVITDAPITNISVVERIAGLTKLRTVFDQKGNGSRIFDIIKDTIVIILCLFGAFMDHITYKQEMYYNAQVPRKIRWEQTILIIIAFFFIVLLLNRLFFFLPVNL